jgi:hypothetical protein
MYLVFIYYAYVYNVLHFILNKSINQKYTDCKNINITEEGVKKLLLNKACGPDGISPRLLKIVAEEVIPALTLIVLPKLLPAV